ncbi:unnamed protein product [Timema podura]|uniref:GRAM domain-containing protein n=2 Tax=Timema TaxID=61471 RepID=A0A7R9K8K0_TIMGE|nr:unnamed protein product [Timema genevievae]CAG2056795.1 unnamed protein product [Timema podura]
MSGSSLWSSEHIPWFQIQSSRILIPIISVLKISKEKTARIIPNAVGVVTEDEKHVFGTLLSRDSTYRFMVQVWKLALSDNAPSIDKEIDTVSADLPPDDDDDDSSLSSEHSCPPTPIETHTSFIHSENKLPVFGPPVFGPPVPVTPSRSMLLLLVSTGLLVMLFFSALFLLYRIGRIQDQFTDGPPSSGSSEDVYQDLLKWQTQLHSKSANEVQEFINSNLNQLAKVRQSLEALALLIVSEEKPAPIDNHRSDSDS